MSVLDAVWKSALGAAQAKCEQQLAKENIGPVTADQQLSKQYKETLIDDFVMTKGPNLRWHTSVIDRMKTCNLDNGLAARKNLAGTIAFSDDDSISTAMSLWLHREPLLDLSKSSEESLQSY